MAKSPEPSSEPAPVPVPAPVTAADPAPVSVPVTVPAPVTVPVTVPVTATAPATAAATGSVTGKRGLASEPFSASFLFDNPSLGRALRYTFADKRLGRAVFMNALFLVIALAIVNELFGRGGLGLLSEKLSFGRAAFLATAIVETAVASLLGPLSFAQLFNAERREDCFDQVVATGCSPLRILLGRYVAALAFVAVVAGSALPFFVFAAVVLSGAEVSDIVLFYFVLGLYTASICAAVLATTVAIEDAAFPLVFALVFTLTAIVAGLSPRAPPALAAWSPFRHLATGLAPITQAIGMGDIAKPFLFGEQLPTAAVSCALYVILMGLSLAYVGVGPDLEFSEGLDSFSSVTLKRGGEASRGRRGLASTLLRTIQLRFLYENLSPRMRKLGPFLRLSATVVLFAASHVIALGMLWPRTPPRGWFDLEDPTTLPYLGFTALSLGLIALSSAGARAAVLARVPVLSLGSIKIGRFPAMFVILIAAIAIPPLLFAGAARQAGLDLTGPEFSRALSLFGLVALYAVFMFALALTAAMLTTNPYSSMGSTLGILVFLNLLPLGWVPLFASNIVTEESARVLDVSPVFAGFALERPGETITFATTRDEQNVKYDHSPDWKPFVYVHAPLAFLLLVIGLGLERRDARGRKYLGALSLMLVLLVFQRDATAQGAGTPPASPWKVDLELGLGGKVPSEGFSPVAASVDNGSGADARVIVLVRDSASGAPLARLGPADVPRGTKRRMTGLASGAPLCEAQSLIVEATTEDGGVLFSAQAKCEPVRAERLLVVLDHRQALPFVVSNRMLRTLETQEPARFHTTWRGTGVARGHIANWTIGYASDALALPSSAQGWTGAGAVILGDLEPRSWSPLASRALAGWLARGGDLVLVVGDRAKSLKESSLGECLGDALSALPAEPPRRNVDVGPLIEVALGKGAGDGRERAGSVARLLPLKDRDEVLVRDGAGEPLVLQRRCGLGRLTIIACDLWQPPLLHLDGASRLLEAILSQGPRYGPRADVLFAELSELRVQPARIGPAFGALLLYALLVGPGIYFLLRPKKKGLLAWLLIPALTVVAAAVTPLYKVVLASSDSAIVTASLLETAAGDPWEVETADGLLVSGGLERHEVFIPGKDVIAASVTAPRSFRETGAFVGAPLGDPSGKTGLSFSLEIPLWGARYITSERFLVNQHRAGEESVPRLKGGVVLKASGPHLVLENHGRETLEDLIVVYPRFVGGTTAYEQPLDASLPNGQPLTAPLSGSPAGAAAMTGSKARELAQSLEHRLVLSRAKIRVEDGRRPLEAVLLAKLADPKTTIDAGPHARVRASATVLLARLPVEFEELVPAGASSVSRTIDIAPVESGAAASPDRIAYVAETRIQLPRGAGAGKPPRRAWVELLPNGTPLAKLGLSVREARDGSWRRLDAARGVRETLDPRDPREPRTTVELASPERLVDADGVILVRQVLELSPDVKPDTACADLDVRLEWAPADR